MTDALAFLGVDGGPAARSPLADPAAAAGARLTTRDGWQIPASFGDPGAEQRACRETVGWVDASQLRTLELQGAPERLGALAASALGDRDGVALGMAARLGDGWWCPVTPGKALVLGASNPAAGNATDPSEQWAGVSVVDVTASYGALRLVGPLARETFARFCALDLRPSVTPVGAFRPGSVARTPGFVLCEAEDRYLMLFGAAHGAYVWEVLAAAATRLGGLPVSLDALQAAIEAEGSARA